MNAVRCLVLAAFVVSLTTQSSVALDHVVLAVNDLDATAARYRALGFTLKPGRPHDNGIRNWHAKFKDGTELELLTAPEPKDALTTTYRKHLAQGDGPAFMALMAKPKAPADGEAPPYIFFGSRNASPTDLPEHFVHANTAYSLIAVWLAGSDFTRERALLTRYGATVGLPRQLLDMDADVMRVAEGGSVYLLPARARIHPDRPIVGVTFRVRDLAEARKVLASAHVTLAASDANHVLLAPAQTGGLWIEFRKLY